MFPAHLNNLKWPMRKRLYVQMLRIMYVLPGGEAGVAPVAAGTEDGGTRIPDKDPFLLQEDTVVCQALPLGHLFPVGAWV